MKRLTRTSLRTLWLAALLMGLFALFATPAQATHATTYQVGDVFVATSNSTVQWRHADGTLHSVLTTLPSAFTTGMAFEEFGDQELYVTGFDGNQVSKFNDMGVLQPGSFGSGYDSLPESILFDASGNAYVGQAGGTKDILKFDLAGTLLASYDVATENIGSDWIDLDADQCTMYYTSEGSRVLRFDVCTNTQLSDFTSTLPGTQAFALRLLVPAQGSGLLVADRQAIQRLDSGGNIVQTYDAAGEDCWFALNLDPDSTSFWSADFCTSNVYKFDIATGAVLLSFNTGTATATVFGLAVKGELTVSQRILTLDPATAENLRGTSHTVTATLTDGAGTPITGANILFSVSGANTAAGASATDGSGQAQFSYTGTNLGNDTITACYDANNSGICDPNELTATATKDWVIGPPASLELDPPTATNTAGDTHCVTATVRDAAGNPTPGVVVNFTVSGANTNGGTGVTDANGQAVFCYIGTVAGTDTIMATAVGGSSPSDTASKTWEPDDPATLELTPATATNTVDEQHCVTATVKDQFGNATPGITVRFSVSPTTFRSPSSGAAVTDAAGQAVFCYTSALPGSDVISAFADTNGNGVQDVGEPGDTAEKTWVVPASTAGCKVTYGGRIAAANGDKGTFGGNAQVPVGGAPKGQEEYQDHGPAAPMNVHSINVQAVRCSANRTVASIFGQATIDGAGTFDYRIDVKDIAEPGTSDTYRIRLSNGYDSGEQLLKGGNIQIHRLTPSGRRADVRPPGRRGGGRAH
ncbi:MAG: Ig-like domain-containing protein [Gaiellaceae bacterium]